MTRTYLDLVEYVRLKCPTLKKKEFALDFTICPRHLCLLGRYLWVDIEKLKPHLEIVIEHFDITLLDYPKSTS